MPPSPQRIPMVTSTMPMRGAGRRSSAATAMAQKLNSMSPPTQADPRTSVLPGNLIMDRCTILLVNNTASVVGSGPTQTAPFCCSLTYQNSTFYSIPWIGAAPAAGQAILLTQPPLMYVLGAPSNV